MLQFRFTVVVLFTAFCSFYGFSQDPCRSELRENRGYRIKIKELRTESQKWHLRNEPALMVAHYFRESSDSVVVYRNDQQAGSFFVKQGRIDSPRFVMHNAAGKIEYIDSFRPDGRPNTYLYLENYWASLTSKWNYYPTGIPSRAAWKDLRGDDSLVIEWSQTGIIRRKKHLGIEYTYSRTGVLLSERGNNWNPDAIAIDYYPNGVLKSAATDTMVKNQLVQHVLNYSPKGILRKESWFKDGKPCETWREYNTNGVLVKTTKNPPLNWVGSTQGVMEAPQEEIYTFVEQEAEYPGGSGPLNKYLNEEFSYLVCRSEVLLSGNYRIHFEIAEDGTPVYLSVEGQNAASIDGSLKQLIGKMPRWVPGKRMGRPVTEGMVVVIGVNY